MIVVYAKSIVPEKNIDKYLEIAKKLVEETRKENGNIFYELIQDTNNKNILAFIEKWENMEVLNKHMKTSHFITLVPKLNELREGESELTIHEILF
ncbi:putative quinol monooxygenase [Fusobacterium varium]|uniref:putative quinol monooxygenase n=1 Tax=Fusobacterium varium TaxID=856 RepID=UPI000BBB623F|nr:putative quinol monooxygenase [uncultured Fusobacterium sp.]BBA52155.1 putative monooxygenase [Fusobacterium varium]